LLLPVALTEDDGDVSKFMPWRTVTLKQRAHELYHTAGG
jgi:hypothetical protein